MSQSPKRRKRISLRCDDTTLSHLLQLSSATHLAAAEVVRRSIRVSTPTALTSTAPTDWSTTIATSASAPWQQLSLLEEADVSTTTQ